MAKKKRNGSRPKPKIPLLATGGAAVFGYQVYKDLQGSAGGSVGKALWENFGVNVGYAGTTTSPIMLGQALKGMAPLIAGLAGSLIAAKTGVNKYVKLPWIKL